jgi:predicted nucleic acid-binding Zn ribbon protein
VGDFAELGQLSEHLQPDAIRRWADRNGGMFSDLRAESLQAWRRETRIAGAVIDAIAFCTSGKYQERSRTAARSWIKADESTCLVQLGPGAIRFAGEDAEPFARAIWDDAALAPAIRTAVTSYLSLRLSTASPVDSRFYVLANDAGIIYVPRNQLAAVHLWLLERAVGTPSAYPDRSCKQCGALFPPNRRGHVFCSERCSDLWRYHNNPKRRSRTR